MYYKIGTLSLKSQKRAPLAVQYSRQSPLVLLLHEIIQMLRTLMLQHTKTPTPMEYTTICQKLIEKYPKLRDSMMIGSNGYVSINVNGELYCIMCIYVNYVYVTCSQDRVLY